MGIMEKIMANEMTPTIAISAMSCLSCFFDWKKAWKKPVGLKENEQILQTFYVCIYTEWKKKTQNKTGSTSEVWTNTIALLYWKIVYSLQPNFRE